MENNNNIEENKTDKNNRKSFAKKWLPYIIVLIVIAIGIGAVFFVKAKNEKVYTYTAFYEDIKNPEEIEKIEVIQSTYIPTGVIKVTFKDHKVKKLNVDDITEITGFLRDNQLEYEVTQPSGNQLVVFLIEIAAMCGVVFFIFTQTKGKNSSLKSAKVKMDNKNKVTFADVAGLDEEKEELAEVVRFLKEPSLYTKFGAKIPKGVLLVGPPGTGKTLLARAVSGEANVPFYQMSGSEFEEMFVGVGASRVRNLFREAKKNSPSIIFIDEIDAVAKKRAANGTGHDETAQTLNQILVEMDGFDNEATVIVLAATNREDILDPAILRPGRFDRKVFVNNPDIKGREEILNIYAKNKPLADNVNLKTIAATTVGFSGADLENLMNEAAILAATSENNYITQEDIDKAFIKVGVGAEKKSKVISKKEREITAYHESGHALLYHLLPDIGPVHIVSIVPTGNAGGYTMPISENDEMFHSKKQMLQTITAAFGGRVAEEIIFNDITTGASQDIIQATKIARMMVTKFGMSDLGAVDFDDDNISEATAKKIDEEINKILTKCYEEAKDIIRNNICKLEASANLLLNKEKISGEEFVQLVDSVDCSRS